MQKRDYKEQTLFVCLNLIRFVYAKRILGNPFIETALHLKGVIY